ncbi:MAG: peptidylprolyl isomerase [Spirochaetes bacterium]|nr:peptidylprolyl isomerase [Spirochaetota bacterium]
MKILLIVLLLFTTVSLQAEDYKKLAKNPKNPIAVLETTQGDIIIELYKENAPETVKNFIDLAIGEKEYYNYKNRKKEKGKFYNGIIFHRVIPNFMIQAGDPTGTGSGGPGYKFNDEINADSLGLDKLKVKDADFVTRMYPPHIIQKYLNKSVKELYESLGYKYITNVKSVAPRKGSVAMANAGPDSNGSQFFINEVDTPWLDGKHTVFGHVIKGSDIVSKIANTKANESNKPLKDVKIKRIRIIE